MNEKYIMFKCRSCGKHTMLADREVDHSMESSRYFTCGHDGRHDNLKVVGMFYLDRFGGIKECMSARSYKKINGRIRRSGR